MTNDLKDFKNVDFHVQMILPNGMSEAGEDNGGVMRDMLSEYWESFYRMRTEGNMVKVPRLSPRMDSKQWKSVACIIALGYCTQGYLPTQLSPAFMAFAISGCEKNKEDIFDEYINYLPKTEAKMIVKARTRL